jgi:hypothetical protein
MPHGVDLSSPFKKIFFYLYLLTTLIPQVMLARDVDTYYYCEYDLCFKKNIRFHHY